MELFLSIIGIAIISMLAYVIWKQQTSIPQRDDTALQVKDEKIGELTKAIKNEESEKNKLIGQNKQMYVDVVTLKEEAKGLAKELDAMKKKVADFEAQQNQNEKEHQQKLTQLVHAQKGFDDERIRVQREDAEKLAALEHERDRLWNEHEVSVIARLNDLCKLPQFSFTSFSNTNLPTEFFGNFKPDFMIDFLGQYVIFDAKASKAESLQTYINNAVIKTAEKIRKNSSIFPIIFLVVPTEAIKELKTTHYPKEDLTFFVISPEALAPVLYCLKRITLYELAEQFDPQKRENIINMLAEMDFHVRMRNGADLVLTKMGADVLTKVQQIDPELEAEVAVKRQERIKNIPPIVNAAMKKLVHSVEEQERMMTELTAPKVAIESHELKKGEEAILKATNRS